MFFDSKKIDLIFQYTLLCVSLFFVINILFFIQYYNLVSESVGLFSILRVIDGLPPISNLGEVPSHLSPYGPYYYVVLGSIFKLLSIKDVYIVTMICRLVTLSLLFYCIKHAAKTLDEKCQNKQDWMFFFVVFFIISFPFLSMMVRADWVAFVLEFLGLCALFKDEKITFRKVIISGVFFGLAPLFKLNSIGVLVGCAFYLLWNKQFRLLFLLTATTGLVCAIGLGISYLHFGINYFLHVIHSSNFGLVPMKEWPQMIDRIFTETIFKNLHLVLIFVVGYYQLKKKAIRVNIVASAIAFNFIIASLFQLKIGAGENYFTPSFICGLLLFPEGWKWFTQKYEGDQTRHALRFLLLFLIVVKVLPSTINFSAFSFNNIFYYPKNDLLQYLDQRFPGKPIYTNDASLSVLLYPRVMLGPWDNLVYVNSKYIHEKYFDKTKASLSKIDFAAIVVAGSSCQDKLPKGELTPDFRDKELEVIVFKKICVFSPKVKN